MKNFFISYNKADRAWAEWIAWQLEEAGYTTVLQAWDFRPGSNFALEMQQATAEAERTVAVLSPDYLATRFTQPEWAAIRLVNKAFPYDSDDVRTWPTCSRLLPHALTASEHAEALKVASEATGRLLNQMGLYLKGRADYAGARAAYERALSIGEATYGPNHPTVATIVNNLGGVLRDLGDLSGARAAYERALRIFREFLGEDHPNTMLVRKNLEGLS